jgi:hypothetical protein
VKLIYIGAHDAVDVPLDGPVQGVITAQRDGPAVDVPDELARRLLEQAENWRLATRQPKPAAAAEKKE